MAGLYSTSDREALLREKHFRANLMISFVHGNYITSLLPSVFNVLVTF